MIDCSMCRRLKLKITQVQKENREALDRLKKLAALESAGVQDWEGYDVAMEYYNDMRGDENEQERQKTTQSR